jgi:quercetin dioxygenase-like cupin family protein
MSEQPFDEEFEISPGFIVERRSVVVGLGGAILAALPRWGVLAQTAGENALAEFLANANPMAKSLVVDTSASGQDRYLRSLAASTSGLHDVPAPDRWNDTNQGEVPGSYQVGVTPGGDPFTVLQWRLEPGAKCMPHAHTYGNVVTVGLEGIARVSNYEVQGVPDYESSDFFEVRQTVDQLLSPGSINLVSLERNYIHGFVAGPDGARGLDITTRLKPKPAFGTPYLDIVGQRPGHFEKIFQASWDFRD